MSALEGKNGKRFDQNVKNAMYLTFLSLTR